MYAAITVLGVSAGFCVSHQHEVLGTSTGPFVVTCWQLRVWTEL
jgi:hypothetical protein